MISRTQLREQNSNGKKLQALLEELEPMIIPHPCPTYLQMKSVRPEVDGAGVPLKRKEEKSGSKQRLEAAELRKKTAKMMDLQYFLEMVDHKHRYGSSLRKYHSYWKTQDTNQNFFYWLDHGDGRDIDLKECSRARLDKEQVRYLSREERLNYLVKVNEQGLLIWAKNELFRDSLKGIVPVSDPTPTFEYNVPPPPGHELDSSSADGFFEDDQDSNVEGDDEGEEDDSNTEGDEGERYVNEKEHVSTAVHFNHMIRSSLKKGRKWIFVADAAFRLYIGYKQSGAFQHSSFLHGARILAAGLIKVKKGKLGRLSPLSGHYRPPTANFRAFVQSLRDAGVDMSHVSISRSYAVLVGMESYGKTRKKIASVEARVMHGKDKLLNPEKVKAEEQAKQDKSESAKKERLYLERQREAEAGQHHGKKDGQSMGTRLAHTLDKLKLQTGGANDSTVKKEEEPRRMPGTGPEDGVPAPGGRR
ncbi:hypothetical protein PV11_00303 [Exophiala sideris]|uniref:IQ domain-containing protein IQM6 n=1 Tax=Exophiala sideris TaxID=1016849 RepID=A0A0D1YSY2_9EURO|nr:hypothetical protein PV11_00303 [Exophiala sideris]